MKIIIVIDLPEELENDKEYREHVIFEIEKRVTDRHIFTQRIPIRHNHETRYFTFEIKDENNTSNNSD